MLISSEIRTNLGKVMFSFDEVALLPPVFPGTLPLYSVGLGFCSFLL